MNRWFHTKIGSRDDFDNWLMQRVGYEVYLKNKLWDSASLLHYITVARCDNLYLEYCKKDDNLVRVDFKRTMNATTDTTDQT